MKEKPYENSNLMKNANGHGILSGHRCRHTHTKNVAESTICYK
jgi:hypothetical protein